MSHIGGTNSNEAQMCWMMETSSKRWFVISRPPLKRLTTMKSHTTSGNELDEHALADSYMVIGDIHSVNSVTHPPGHHNYGVRQGSNASIVIWYTTVLQLRRRTNIISCVRSTASVRPSLNSTNDYLTENTLQRDSLELYLIELFKTESGQRQKQRNICVGQIVYTTLVASRRRPQKSASRELLVNISTYKLSNVLVNTNSQRPLILIVCRSFISQLIHASLSVLGHPSFKEICFPLQRYHVHKVKGVCSVVKLMVTEGYQQMIGYKLDVLTHELGVHTNEGYRQGICEPLMNNATPS